MRPAIPNRDELERDQMRATAERQTRAPPVSTVVAELLDRAAPTTRRLDRQRVQLRHRQPALDEVPATLLRDRLTAHDASPGGSAS